MIFTPRFPALFWRQSLRPAIKKPGLSLLTIGGIGLGVAVFLAVQVANRAALESFRASVELAAGRAHLEARGEFADDLFPALRAVEGVRAAAPLVEGIAPLSSPPGEYLRILGVDPLAAPELFAFRLQGADGQSLDLRRWMAEPGVLAVNPVQMRRMAEWGEVEAVTATGRHSLKPVFEMVSEEALAQAEPRLAAMDIGWAQILLGKTGRLTGAQFLLHDEAEAEKVAEKLRALLPPDVTVAPPARRNAELQTMLGAFQLNLTAMSLVSVIVGMFLVYNSVSAAVVRRQPQIAILRACGASRGEVRTLFLGEALIEGAAGSALGVLAAPWLAAGLAQPIGQTVASLYDLASLDHVALSPAQAILGLGVGVGAALLAAWFPATEAANVEPATILHSGAPNRVFAPNRFRVAAGAALALMLAALTGWLALKTGPKIFGFLSAGFVIAAFTLLVPVFASTSASCGRFLGILGRLAADHLDRSLHRNGITIAAMSAAVAMAVAVGVMIHSFRASVLRWTDRTLSADAYLAPAANEIGGLHSLLPAEAGEWARAHPSVQSVAAFREFTIRWKGEPVSLGVLDGAARGSLEILPGAMPNALEAFGEGRAALVSESFVSRFGGKPDTIALPLPGGIVHLPVGGVFRDFTRDRGTIFVQRAAVRHVLPDASAHSLAITFHNPRDLEAFARDFQSRFAGRGEFAIYDNAGLRKRILEIFDQTFAVTAALRAIAIFVAAIGIVFSLTILAGERAREIGVLRALGASQGQVLGVFLGEAGLVGLASALCGLAGGAVLALVLTWVINKAFFGWSIALSYPLGQMVWTVPALILVSALSGLLPALMAARTPPAAAVRFE